MVSLRKCFLRKQNSRDSHRRAPPPPHWWSFRGKTHSLFLWGLDLENNFTLQRIAVTYLGSYWKMGYLLISCCHSVFDKYKRPHTLLSWWKPNKTSKQIPNKVCNPDSITDSLSHPHYSGAANWAQPCISSNRKIQTYFPEWYNIYCERQSRSISNTSYRSATLVIRRFGCDPASNLLTAIHNTVEQISENRCFNIAKSVVWQKSLRRLQGA